MTRSGLRIGEMAQRAGVSIDTIRYYERRKLLPRARRSDGGFRIFALEDAERVRFIKQAQEIGFSLDEIRSLLTGSGTGDCQRMRDLLKAKLEDIDRRMKGLRTFMRILKRHLQACEDELVNRGPTARCPVIVEIGNAAKRGLRK